MARKGRDTREELASYRKEIGKQYMDGLISDKEYERLLYAKEAELGLGEASPAEPQEGPECPSCGALLNPQDTECLICGVAVMPAMATVAPVSAGAAPRQSAAPPTWREDWIDKQYRDMPPEELLKQPPEVLKGVSQTDSKKMADAFNVKTIEDFAALKHLGWAQELAALKKEQGAYRKEEFGSKLVKEYEKKELDEVLKAPPHALQGVSEADSKKLAKAFNVKTVEDLGNLKFVAWAQEIHNMAQEAEHGRRMSGKEIPPTWREDWLDKQNRSMPPEELLKQPPEVLKGVSPGDSDRMKAAFNIRTLEDFGTCKYILWSQELAAMRDDPAAYRKEDFEHKLIKEYEEKGLDEILSAPTHALQGVSEADSRKLTKAFNAKTVEELGNLKYAVWANMIYSMAPPKIYKIGDRVLMPSGQEGRVSYVTEPNIKGIQEVEVAVGK